MSFPIKMNIPQYTFTVPSTKDKVQFRPFLVGEQKSMMLSLATEDTDTIVDSIKMLINTCSNGKIDSNKLAPFDLEYLFLQLRARSIGETVNLSAACGKCDGTINFKLDISQAEVDFSNTIDKKIQLTDDIGVEMRYPTLAENIKLNAEDVKEDVLMNTTIDCIVSVWNSEDYVTTSEYPRETVIEFINTLTVPQFEKLTTFLLYVPTVKFIKKMPCPSCRTENTIRVEGLENFFG
jgi:hypothetical protein